MRFLVGVALFILGFSLASGLFWLGLLVWGDQFEHAAPLVSDGVALAWLLLSLLAGAASSGLIRGCSRQPGVLAEEKKTTRGPGA